MTQLCRAVQTEGVVLSGLRGMGGVGKTALALKLAEKLTPDYPDAQLFVNLYGAPDTPTPPTTPAAAMQQVVRAFHPAAKLPEDPSQLAALYHSVLHGKKALILLDDARDAAQVQPLLPPPTCLLLVTTRHKFTLPGLQELDLDSLPLEEAVALIGKITPRAGEQAEAIATACGCLPLALRLAASALREQANLGADALLKKLTNAEKRFTTLAKVRAAIQVSYDLLADDLQTALRQLAVFPAGFDQPAAAAVWDVDADAAQERLAALMQASLVSYDANTARYRLHDLVRAATEGLLEESEKYAAGFRHAAHYLHVLRIADSFYLKGGDNILNALSLFDRERENILPGQTWAAGNKQDKNAAQICADYYGAGAYCLTLRLNPHEQIIWLQNALSATREIGDRRGEGAALGNLGNAYAALGQVQTAIEYYQQRIEIAREIGDRRGEGADLGNLGIAYRNLGQVQTAIEYYQQQLEITREIGDRRGEANTSWNLGSLLADQGKLQEAIPLMQMCVNYETEIGHPEAQKRAARVEELKKETGISD